MSQMFCVFFCLTKLSYVLHSASKQHISGGREHSGPIQSIPSPEFHSRLHRERRETGPIGELSVEAAPCCSSTRDLPLQRTDPCCLQRNCVACCYGVCLFFWRGWRGLFVFCFLKISAHRRLPVKKERKKRLFKQNFKICMTTAQSLISVHPHRHPALFARKTLVDISSAQPRINTRESVFPVF